jgi:hypothetical protein
MKRDKEAEEYIKEKLYRKVKNCTELKDMSIAIHNLKDWFDLTVSLDLLEKNE